MPQNREMSSIYSFVGKIGIVEVIVNPRFNSYTSKRFDTTKYVFLLRIYWPQSIGTLWLWWVM